MNSASLLLSIQSTYLLRVRNVSLMSIPLRFFKEISFRDSQSRHPGDIKYKTYNETLPYPVIKARRLYTTDTLNTLYIVLTVLL